MRGTWTILILIVFVACGQRSAPDLFHEHFEPYMDIVGSQEPTERNMLLLEGMEHYNVGEYADALIALSQHSEKYPDLASPYFYMGICELSLGNSYEAELQFDHLDNLVPNGFIDQSEWYTALSLLYSGQTERCRTDLELIVEQKKHAYNKQAVDLLEALERNGL